MSAPVAVGCYLASIKLQSTGVVLLCHILSFQQKKEADKVDTVIDT